MGIQKDTIIWVRWFSCEGKQPSLYRLVMNNGEKSGVMYSMRVWFFFILSLTLFLFFLFCELFITECSDQIHSERSVVLLWKYKYHIFFGRQMWTFGWEFLVTNFLYLSLSPTWMPAEVHFWWSTVGTRLMNPNALLYMLMLMSVLSFHFY